MGTDPRGGCLRPSGIHRFGEATSRHRSIRLGLLVTLIPVVGGLLLLFWFLSEGTPGQNRFGPSPKGLVAPDRAADPAWPVMRLRTHLDAQGRLIGHDYID